jgi:hypothetical protein
MRFSSIMQSSVCDLVPDVASMYLNWVSLYQTEVNVQ